MGKPNSTGAPGNNATRGNQDIDRNNVNRGGQNTPPNQAENDDNVEDEDSPSQ